MTEVTSRFPVISVRQPWADQIVSGLKDVENRSRRTSFRGNILIHASRTAPDAEALAGMRDFLRMRKVLPKGQRYEPEFGGIVGMVKVVDCVTSHDSPFFLGPFGWILADPVLFDTLIECPGKVGIFYVSRDLLRGTPAARAKPGTAGAD